MINSSATYGYGKMSHSSESPYSQRLACQAAGTLVYSSEQEILGSAYHLFLFVIKLIFAPKIVIIHCIIPRISKIPRISQKLIQL